QLFKSAELWGPQFIAALDLYCLQNAIATYTRLWEEEHQGVKSDSLAINVYPETLFQPEYKKAVKRIIEEENIINNRLILEISEKRPIPSSSQIGERTQDDTHGVDWLISKIHEYTNEFQIGFAIDDFGVGHSSVTRLIKLELDHIKIDRDILLNPHPEITIAFVRNIVKAAHAHPFTIIVEGFDGESRLSLKQLYDLGVQYIQGHMIRMASPSLANLSQDEKTFIVNELK
ncbi:MAG TPA: EAL domain-containing protein, partial [Anaerolineales bacterium]|nr:EAL domain-containing protein [Anaerolineales bacterium]